MEDTDRSGLLKEKLLLAGMDEMVAHGINGFSLRRVAAACGASCAAPYKHFKNKEDFIKAIMAYVDEKWLHLSKEIARAFDNPVERIAELCCANVRFKIANPLYSQGSDSFFESLDQQIAEVLAKDSAIARRASFSVEALVAGTASLIESGKLANDQGTFKLLKDEIMADLS